MSDLATMIWHPHVKKRGSAQFAEPRRWVWFWGLDPHRAASKLEKRIRLATERTAIRTLISVSWYFDTIKHEKSIFYRYNSKKPIFHDILETNLAATNPPHSWVWFESSTIYGDC